MNITKGWKLVPVEPTQEMMEAGMNSTGDQLNGRPVWKATLDEQAAHIFRAMLAAAPTPPVKQDEEDSYCPTCGEEDGGTGCGAIRCGLVDGEQDDEVLVVLRRVANHLSEVGNHGDSFGWRNALKDARALLTKRGAA